MGQNHDVFHKFLNLESEKSFSPESKAPTSILACLSDPPFFMYDFTSGLMPGISVRKESLENTQNQLCQRQLLQWNCIQLEAVKTTSHTCATNHGYAQAVWGYNTLKEPLWHWMNVETQSRGLPLQRKFATPKWPNLEMGQPAKMHLSCIFAYCL